MNIVIIGAGPSGLMCAIEASKNEHKVIILEKNEKAGKKIYITGKGRCNVTNNCSVNDFMKNIAHNGKFLYSALNTFSPKDTIDFFQNNGVPLITERGNRVFPKSYKASDITKTLLKECEKNKVKIYYHTKIDKIKKNKTFNIYYNNTQKIEADKLVIATGGMSYPSTGSTGDGYDYAIKFNHQIKSLKPCLVALKIKDKVSYDAKGLTLKNVALHSYNDKVHNIVEGELTFDNGLIDGPIVIKTSSLICDEDNIKLYLDLKIGLTKEQLETKLIKEFSSFSNITLKEELSKLLPIQMISDFINRLSINPKTKLCQITKEERAKIINYLKKYNLEYIGPSDFNRAIITRGGISIKDLNPKTFESKITQNLYFIGEIIDVDAFTGGFNMQIALSTGYTCGKNII